jgi:hypothetical protein
LISNTSPLVGEVGARSAPGEGFGVEDVDFVSGLSRPSMASEALGLLPGVTLSPTPLPSRERG